MTTERKTGYLLLSMYVAGLIGLNVPATAELFKQLTPYNLLFSGVVLLYFQRDKTPGFWFFTVFTFLTGYLVEVLGVNTGLIFGDYEYTKTLGFEIWNVPPIIGVNWLLVTYCTGYMVQKTVGKYVPNRILLVLIAAAAMTAFDYVVEPVAIRLEMWEWATGIPPLSNYVGWFMVSMVVQAAFFYAPFRKENPLAAWLFVLQLLFFGLQWVV